MDNRNMCYHFLPIFNDFFSLYSAIPTQKGATHQKKSQIIVKPFIKKKKKKYILGSRFRMHIILFRSITRALY